MRPALPHARRKPVRHAPLPHHDRRKARGTADAARAPRREQPVPAHKPCVRQYAEQHLGPFRHDEIRVRVDDDAAHALTYEPAAPAVQAESVMEHDDRPVAQHRAQPSVCRPIEPFEEAHRNVAAPPRLPRILRPGARRRHEISETVDRLVEHFDAVQRRAVAVTSRETLEHVQCERNLPRRRMPADNAGQAAIVEPVLRPGHGVQVDEHLKPGPLRPVERTVEVFDASGMPGHVTEDEKRHGDAHKVQPVRGDGAEVVLGDVRVAVTAQQALQFGRVRGPVQPDLVLLAARTEQAGRHPPFQYQPAAEVHSVDSPIVFRHGPLISIPHHCSVPRKRHRPLQHTTGAGGNI